MATFLGLGTSVLFGNTVRASTELLVDFIAPIEPNDTITVAGNVVIEGNISGDAINLTATETNIGVGAGQSTAGQDNTFVGASAGAASGTGNRNTFVGQNAGAANTTGDNNVFVGQESGLANTTGTSNTVVGTQAGLSNTSGGNNVFVGLNAGRVVTTGEDNVLVGLNAGVDIVTGSKNVCLGLNTRGDAALDGCVLIGDNAGANNTVNDRLMIDNTNTNEPLIDGDFSGDTIQFNGVVTLGQTGNTTNQHEVNGSVDGAGAAGAGGAVPATVEEYLVVTVNGNTRRIALFL